MSLAQPSSPSSPSQRARNNVANAPSSEFEHVKPSMTNTIVKFDKANADVLNKTKDEIRELSSKFKDRCPSIS